MTPALSGPQEFFLAQSALQLVLAAALAEQSRQIGAGRRTLLFLPDVLEPQRFEQALRRWSDPPFDDMVFVAPRRLPGPGRKRRSWRAVREDIGRVLEQSRPDVVTVFNDRQDAGQTVLISAAQRFPHALRRCAEDGALAYTNFTYRPHSAYTALRQRWRLGSGWADVRVLGSHPLVQQFSAIHPELLRPELCDNRVRPFPSQQLSSDALRRFAASFCALTGFEPHAIPPRAALIMLSHSSYARRNPDYLRLLTACRDGLRERGIPFFVKYHPREADDGLLRDHLAGARGEVPRILPAECLYLLQRECPLLVIAGMSTSLLTPALLMQQASCAALVHASPTGDAWDARLLQASRITPLAEPAALLRYLDGWRDAAGVRAG